MARITIEGMKFYAFHGCFEEEASIGTNFTVNVWMDTNTKKAQKSDNIEDTVNYLTVYQKIKKELKERSNLLEHIAERIIKMLHKEFPAIEKAGVKVYKMNPPLGGQMHSVSVYLESDDVNND